MIRDNVKRIRKAKGVMATHISKALGYKTPQGYHYLENGQANISAEKLKAIAGVLGEDVSIFFDDKLTEIVLQRIRGAEIVRD